MGAAVRRFLRILAEISLYLKGCIVKVSLAILLALILTPGVTSTTAQTPTTLSGFQVIAERQYAAETESTIDTTGDGVFLASARVYLFDNEQAAEPTWNTLVDAESIATDLGDEADDKLVREELEQMGDRGMALSISVELDAGATAEYRSVMTQRGAMIVTVTMIAGSADAATIADDIAAAMIDREPGTSPSVYDGYGASTGGVWEVFLPQDAEELTGLTAYLDKETRPSS